MVSGLDGVVVAETKTSDVDGANGRLVVRGVAIADLAAEARLEAAMRLLWGLSDDPSGALGAARARHVAAVAAAPALGLADPMAALRAVLAGFEDLEPTELVAVTGLVLACFVARAQGRPVPAPDPTRDHAEDVLAMATGHHDPALGRAFGQYLCTVVDHGMNASTFAARVVASTGSDTMSAVVAAVGALKGPLHGGAPGPVLDMLDEIGTPDAAEAWVEAALADGRRIMGIGHRIYRVRDPRVAVLESVLEGLDTDRTRRNLARTVEATAVRALAARKPGRALQANVEFATALVLEAVGLPRSAFSVAFACGRVVGWLAHIDEQRRGGRLIRPLSKYVGP